jgi:hypothetical protein
MWDPASASAQSERMDYRSTKLYQNTLATCTEGGMTALVTYPHRHFFGTGDDDPKSGAFQVANNAHWLRWSHLTDKSGRSKQGLYGIVPIAEFLSLGKAASQPHDFNIMYQPSESDVSLVRGTLCKMGLPVELALDIMELAGYEPKKLKVEHDPLHPENREELAKYLKYCWQLLVRCDIIATEAGRQIKWYDAVAKCMINFLDSKDCKLRNQWFKIDYYEEWEFPYFFP